MVIASSFEFHGIRPEHDVTRFDCGDDPWAKEVADFLKENALDDQKRGMSSTWLVFKEGELVGYTSLLAYSFSIKSWRETATEWFTSRFSTQGIRRQVFPCVLIGQMGVSRDRQGEGIGKLMLDWILAEAVAAKIGVRFLSLHVDSKNEAAKRFWEKAGFVQLGELSGSDAKFMIYDLFESATG